MAGLLGGVLPAIYSTSDQIKRQIYGLLTNPSEMAQRAGQSLLQSRAERQALMGQAFANPERPLQVTNPQALAQLGQDVLTSELGIAPVGMIAYHGTPHLIKDKFDISKVGTGEGAQAYGHGMYFAENPTVAGQYAKELGTRVDVNGKPLMQQGKIVGSTGNAELDDFLVANLGDVKAARKDLLQSIKEVRPTNPEAAKDYQRLLADLRKSQVSAQSTGNLYKVDIPDEYIPNMLDWDKPLNMQTPEVLKALKIPKDAVDKYNSLSSRLEELQWQRGGIDSPEWEKVAKEAVEIRAKYGLHRSGEEVYREVAQLAKDMGNENFSQVAAENLKRQGITGIRYLDEGSRGKARNQTSNFVVFDPTNVKILERNNQPLEGLLD